MTLDVWLMESLRVEWPWETLAFLGGGCYTSVSLICISLCTPKELTTPLGGDLLRVPWILGERMENAPTGKWSDTRSLSRPLRVGRRTRRVGPTGPRVGPGDQVATGE